MIIYDFDILGTRFRPAKANTDSIINANTVLSYPITPESLEAISWWDAEVLQPPGDFKLPQLAPRDRFNSFQSLHPPAAG
jgi:hypothetical protein